jgi:hypothetical protein
MNISTLRAFGFALILAAPAVGSAQDAPPAPPTSVGPTGAHHWGHGPMPQGRWSPEGRHLKAIHDILGIKPDQEAAFQAYASALHPQTPAPGAPARDWPDHKALAAMTTPERLDLMSQRIDAREAKMHARFERVIACRSLVMARAMVGTIRAGWDTCMAARVPWARPRTLRRLALALANRRQSISSG